MVSPSLIFIIAAWMVAVSSPPLGESNNGVGVAVVVLLPPSLTHPHNGTIINTIARMIRTRFTIQISVII